MPHSSIYLRHSRSVSVFLMVLTKVNLYLGYPCLSLAGSLGREHLKGLLELTLCLISVTTIGAIPSWNSLVHFFLQRCPSLNLWSNASPFPGSLLFPISKPLYILFPLPGILFTEKKSNPFFKANAKASLIILAKTVLSNFSQPWFMPYWSLSTL